MPAWAAWKAGRRQLKGEEQKAVENWDVEWGEEVDREKQQGSEAAQGTLVWVGKVGAEKE